MDLITGATGFIGGRIYKPGDRMLVREPLSNRDCILGDLRDPESLFQACRGIDTVFHCAGHSNAFNSSNSEQHWQVNYEGTRNLVESAGKAGVQRFVFLSSVKAMAEPGNRCVDEAWSGRPVTHYGLSKRAAEDAAFEVGDKYNMHVVSLRLPLVYGRGGHGNLERMARGIRAGWFPPLPETGNRRSLVHVDDVVTAARLVAREKIAAGQAYIVADSCPYSTREIYDALCVAVGNRAPGWRIPIRILRGIGFVGTLMEGVFGRPMPVNEEIISRLIDSACYSPAKIERDLGWRSRITLNAGIQEMLN